MKKFRLFSVLLVCLLAATGLSMAACDSSGDSGDGDGLTVRATGVYSRWRASGGSYVGINYSPNYGPLAYDGGLNEAKRDFKVWINDEEKVITSIYPDTMNAPATILGIDESYEIDQELKVKIEYKAHPENQLYMEWNGRNRIVDFSIEGTVLNRL